MTPTLKLKVQSAEDALYRRVTLRLLPLLLIAFLLAYLDRVNIGFAKLDMQRDLGYSEAVYGLGAGIFFVGYMLFEVPSNLLLHRLGAKFWIARIMISWGLISAATALVRHEWQFYGARFLLGLAEAGFFPGVILYVTYWYPAHRRGRVISLFLSGVAMAGILGGPVSGWILKYCEGWLGYRAWQWLFVLEGLPSIVVGCLIFVFLDDHIVTAKWLSLEEKALLQSRIQEEEATKEPAMPWSFLRNPHIWLMIGINFSLVMGLYGISFWLPTLIHNMGVEDSWHIGLLSAIPWVLAVLVMLAMASSADRRRERRWHLAIPAIIGSLGLTVSVLVQDVVGLQFVALIFATVGIQASLPLFWSLPTALLTTRSAAAAIALINTLSNLAGFVSPSLVGWLNQMTRSSSSGILLLAAFLLLAAVLTVAIPARLVNT